MNSKMMITVGWILSLTLGLAQCNGQAVLVTVTGEVEFNQVSAGFLGTVNPGDSVQMQFELDADNFIDSANFPTRGYSIDQDSFALNFAGNSIGLQDPFPAGETPYFVLRDNDPVADGFFVATSTDFPVGVPINQPGIFDQFSNSFSVTYGGSRLSSLNILDAVGSYGFDGLSVFNWTIDDGPFQPVGIVFSDLTISANVVPEPSAFVALLSAGSVLLLSRRRQL